MGAPSLLKTKYILDTMCFRCVTVSKQFHTMTLNFFYFVICNIEGIRFLCYENLLPHTIHIHMNDTSTKPFYYYRQ